MKSYTRKLAGGGNSKSAGSFSGSTASSTTSAAAVAVNKFGQATFTSIRRNDYENGTSKFVPLQNTVSGDVNQDAKQQQLDVKAPPPPKPKVFKFFKSRAPGNGDSSSENKSSINTATKALVLNNTSKDDGVKRITTTIGRNSASQGRSNKGDKSANQNSQPSDGTKTFNLSPNKSCEIKVCGDKTFKKVISPTKTTQFVIRNSNVRNATKQMNAPTNVLSGTRGVRTSRRLKGIEPEPSLNKSLRKSQTVHLVYDKSSSPSAANTSVDDIFAQVARETTENAESNNTFTTMIEESKDESEEVCFCVTSLNFILFLFFLQEATSEQNEEDMDVDKPNDHMPLESNVENENDEVVNENDEIENEKDEVDNENDKEVEKEKISETPIEDEPKTSDQLISSQEYCSADSQTLESEISSQTEVGSSKASVFSDSQPENKSVTAKPKKKIFSNRDRSKVEFNTKSFFNSAVKDEFDMDMEDQPAAGAPPSNADKKNGHENDDADPDQYIKLKRIKKAHQCHDLGETEQFDEDIKYYLSGIVATNTNSMRCLRLVF